MLHWHHIIPKHAGGTDEPSNLKQFTIEGHAEEHKILYEKYGKLEDSLAYRGLLGLINKKDILKELCSRKGKENPNFGKRGPLHPGFGKKRPEHSEVMKRLGFGRNKSAEHLNNWSTSFRNRAKVDPVAAKTWKVTTASGEVLTIRNMAKFCRENGLGKSGMSIAASTGTSYRGFNIKKES